MQILPGSTCEHDPGTGIILAPTYCAFSQKWQGPELGQEKSKASEEYLVPEKSAKG